MNLDNSKLDKEFVDKYKKYLLSEEMIAYSEVKDWIGYKYKKSVLENLEDGNFGFKKDIDYKIIKEKKEGICKPVNEIYITFDTLKLLCMGSTSEIGKKYRNYLIEIEKATRDMIKDKIKNPISNLSKYEFDINQWTKKKVVYLIYIKDNLYKFGISSNPEIRFSTHRAKLNYSYVMKCWDCHNMINAKKIEDELKKYLRCNKLLTTYARQTEIFTATTKEELNVIINKINEFHKKHLVLINNKVNEELNKKLEKEDQEYDFSNRELVLIEKYKRDYNLNINKELFDNLKSDFTNLSKIESALKQEDKPIDNKPEIIQEELNQKVKCAKCKNEFEQSKYEKKEDGTYYKQCERCLELSRINEAKRKVRKPLTEEQKQCKYAKRKEKRLLEKLNNPKEKEIKQTKEEKLQKKKIYYEENKEEIRTKYANRMSSEEAKQKERERKKAYYWNNHDKLIERNREFYKENADELKARKRQERKNKKINL